MTATDKDGGTSSQVNHTIEVIQPVDIDVKPGNAKNKVNAKSQGVIPVAIYKTADFDAATVDGNSVQLAGVSADHATFRHLTHNGGDLHGCQIAGRQRCSGRSSKNETEFD